MTTRQAFIIAGGIVIAGIAIGVAQPTQPQVLTGCVYYSSPGTLTNGQQTVLTCDSTGKLRVTTSF